MKKLLSLLLIICICFCAVGCNKETDTIHIDEQEGSSDANTTNYQPQIDSLNKTISELKKQIESLKNENEALKSNIKSLTESTISNNKYTITKEELIGTWAPVNLNDSGEYVKSTITEYYHTYTNENIIDIYEDYIFLSINGYLSKIDYVYYDGLLITNGSAMWMKI